MKKLLALCLTVMLVVAMVPVFAVSADATLTFSAANVTAKPGQIVEVAVSISNNPGISSARVDIAYDADALEIVPYTYYDEDAGDNMTTSAQNMSLGNVVADFSPTTVNPFIVNWVPGTKNIKKNGDLAIIYFKVKDTAAVGTYTLEVIANQDDVFNVATEAVPFTLVNGSIKVVCEHEATEIVGKLDATCQAAGYTGDEVCSKCGETIKAGSEIAKLAHTEVVEGAVDADCENAGSTGTTKCSVCGETIKEAEVIDALGHKTELVGAKDATCEAAGYTGDEVCTVCGETIKTGEVIDQLAHNWVAVEKKDATCAAEGMEAHYACDAGCGKLAADAEGAEEVAAADLVIAKLAHTISKVAGVAATEEKAGVKEHYACSECNGLFADEAGEKAITADEVVIPAIEKAPENSDTSDKAPATNDLVNMFVVVAMLIAAAATVVVLKKKA